MLLFSAQPLDSSAHAWVQPSIGGGSFLALSSPPPLNRTQQFCDIHIAGYPRSSAALYVELRVQTRSEPEGHGSCEAYG